MSIITGEPRGRVIFNIAHRGIPGAGCVAIIHRDRVGHVSVYAYSETPDDLVVEWGATPKDTDVTKLSFTRAEDGVAVYRSIVEEDGDVIWTSDASGHWTRVPDRKEVP